jgi:hypothetical protein
MDMMPLQMHDQDDASPNAKVILLAVGGAATVAALLIGLARRRDEPEPKERVEAAVKEAKKDAKKAAKAAKKKQKELRAAASESRERVAGELKETAEKIGIDAKQAERDLKAAAWDAQQEAREAESRLRAMSHRVVDDATHLATRVGSGARSLTGEGMERIAHLRHREEEPADELARLRAEIDDLKAQLADDGRRAEKESRERIARLMKMRKPGKGGSMPEAMASEAAAAALTHMERTLRSKVPDLLAAKNRAQVLDVLQRELGPTLRETAAQAAAAAFEMWDSAREKGEAVREEARHLADETADATRDARADALRAADDAKERAEAAAAKAKGRWWGSADGARKDVATSGEHLDEAVDEVKTRIGDDVGEEEHRSKAGLFWGGAGLGLALYALLDAERREKVLRLANEASVQVQELVRDLQGYDDEY